MNAAGPPVLANEGTRPLGGAERSAVRGGHARTRAIRPSRRQRGMGLMEIMVGMLISMLMVLIM